jgi:ubiquinone/menaquinone biosynthesis C-methylase UbiE
MNAFENWFCASAVWGYVTRKKLLPWVLEGSEIGEHVLELGAGPGAATEELRRRSARVTSLEYSHNFAVQLHVRSGSNNGASSSAIVQGDAATLPFADGTFSSAIAVLMLHHLRAKELQDRAFAEIYRVLRPGGVFLAFEIQNSWLNRAVHMRSTFVPLEPASLSSRLEPAGWSSVRIEARGDSIRLRAVRGPGT